MEKEGGRREEEEAGGREAKGGRNDEERENKKERTWRREKREGSLVVCFILNDSRCIIGFLSEFIIVYTKSKAWIPVSLRRHLSWRVKWPSNIWFIF